MCLYCNALFPLSRCFPLTPVIGEPDTLVGPLHTWVLCTCCTHRRSGGLQSGTALQHAGSALATLLICSNYAAGESKCSLHHLCNRGRPLGAAKQLHLVACIPSWCIQLPPCFPQNPNDLRLATIDTPARRQTVKTGNGPVDEPCVFHTGASSWSCLQLLAPQAMASTLRYKGIPRSECPQMDS